VARATSFSRRSTRSVISLVTAPLETLAQRAGIPSGVLNVITGDSREIGGEMTSNPDVRKITFAGSTEVGRLLMKQSSTTIKKLSLELGGNAACIVDADADLVRPLLAEELRLWDLDVHRLRGIPRPEHLFQVVAVGLERCLQLGKQIGLFAEMGEVWISLGRRQVHQHLQQGGAPAGRSRRRQRTRRCAPRAGGRLGQATAAAAASR